MEMYEAIEKATLLLRENGYKFNGSNIIAPEAKGPLDAISIQHQLSDITYYRGQERTLQLKYIGDNLKLVEAEI